MILANDTIAAIATSGASSAISIIRLSGNLALEIALKITKKQSLKPRLATLCKIYDNETIIDEIIVLYFQAPKSYTGEDLVEFQCHGGEMMAKVVLQLLLTNGAILAKAGEFSKRAFLNDKISINKLDAIAKIINAKSKRAILNLARHINGDLDNLLKDMKNTLLFALACSEALIDYSEEVESEVKINLQSSLKDLIIKIEKIIKASNLKENAKDCLQVAILGAPNAGKSSLLNALLMRERAIISDICGTTRDSISEEITINGTNLKIIDTAGIRSTEDEIESIGIQRSLGLINEADIIIMLIDASTKFNDEINKIFASIKSSQAKIIYVLNKSDLKNNFAYNWQKEDTVVEISAKNKQIEALLAVLENEISSDDFSSELYVSADFQKHSLKIIKEEIEHAKNAITKEEVEIFSYHLNKALKEIDKFSEKSSVEDILDVMFGSFCLGK